jgi:hypothetical protein
LEQKSHAKPPRRKEKKRRSKEKKKKERETSLHLYILCLFSSLRLGGFA